MSEYDDKGATVTMPYVGSDPTLRPRVGVTVTMVRA
jgi:hypothetical protein